MEIGLREWLVIGGIVLIALIILDGWRRMRSNRGRLKMDIDRSVADLPDEPVRSFNPELPNGGARVVGGSDPLFSDLRQPAELERVPVEDDPAIEPTSPQPAPVSRHEETRHEVFADEQGRREPVFGDEPAAVDEPFDDNAEFDELLGPARVVSAAANPVAEEPVTATLDEDLRGHETSPLSREVFNDPEPIAESDSAFEPEAEPPLSVKRIAPDEALEEDGLFTAENQLRYNPLAETTNTEAEELTDTDWPDDGDREMRDELDDLRWQPVEPEPEVELLAPAAESKPPALDTEPEPEPAPARTEPVFQQNLSSGDELDIDLDKPIPLDFGEPETPPLFPEEPQMEAARQPVASKAHVAPAAKAQTPIAAAGVDNAATEKSAEPKPVTRDLFAERPSLEKTPEPQNVLIITVLAGKANDIEGARLLPLISACGMRYGDMSIFHRFEDGPNEGAVQFSMANAVNPGTFDLDTMEDSTTRGLTFFMSMEEPRDVMNAFECMLATAETVSKHMGAELLDENRSVLRPQTKEHYRQRIRDFEMRNLSRRAH